LTAIKAAVSSLRDDSVVWAEADHAAFLETIESQTDRLTATLANLLEMTRIENGLAKVHLEPIEVAPLLAEAAIATSAATRGRQVTTCAEEAIWLRGDYGLLVQALTNLVENAAKYSPARTPITLKGTRQGARIALSVVDAGPGPGAEEAPFVFEKWFRARSVGGATGTGLGLALVKAIAELNGGSVSLDSVAGATTFSILLPPTLAPS
jgi:two-component system sensor histidine kinase KdpD